MKEHYFGDMRMLEIHPSIALKPYVEKYYLYEKMDDRLNRHAFRALPNGWVEMFLLFNGNRVTFLTTGQRMSLSGFIAGIFELNHPMKIKVELNGHPMNGISVVLTHLGVNRILDRSLRDLTNQILDFSSIWGSNQQWLQQNVLETNDVRQKLKNLNDFFLSRVSANHRPAQRILFILNRLEQMAGPLTVDRVAVEFNISYKSLYRMFIEEIGLTPKMYLKILRFNQACWMLSRQPSVSWSDLVDRCGYYDQSHFIHEFKAIMKKSPLQYLKSSRGSFYLDRAYVFR